MVGGNFPSQTPDFGHDYCIDCHAYTARRLMAHIPHICTNCLFPYFQPINLVSNNMRLRHRPIGLRTVR